MSVPSPRQATVPLPENQGSTEEYVARERRHAQNAIQAGADSMAVAERFRSRTGGDLGVSLERNQAQNVIKAGGDSAAVAERFRSRSGQDLVNTPGTQAIVESMVERDLAEREPGFLERNLGGFGGRAGSEFGRFIDTLGREGDPSATLGPILGVAGGPQAIASGVGRTASNVARTGRRILRRPASAEKVSKSIAPRGAQSIERTELRKLVNQVRQTDERITPDVQRKLLSPDGKSWLAEQIRDPKQFKEAIRLIERGVSGSQLKKFLGPAAIGTGVLEGIRRLF